MNKPVLYTNFSNITKGFEQLMSCVLFRNVHFKNPKYNDDANASVTATVKRLRELGADEARIHAILNTKGSIDNVSQENISGTSIAHQAATLPVSEMQDPYWWRNRLKSEFQEFGGTAFVIDGVIPNQVCRMVEIQQIIDDTAILKCQPGGGIMIRKLTELFHNAHDCNEAISLKRMAKRMQYLQEISDMQSLIRFMLKHDISPNKSVGDAIAREIAIEKAREMGVNLTDITN